MKNVRFLAIACSALSLLLCAWALFQLSNDDVDLIQTSLNLIYFVTLLITFVTLRIALNYSVLSAAIVGLIAVAIIVLSTYTWLNPSELLIFGRYTLALIPLLVGSTLIISIKNDSTISRIMQVAIALLTGFIAYYAYIGIETANFYTYSLYGLALISVATIVHLIFVRPTS